MIVKFLFCLYVLILAPHFVQGQCQPGFREILGKCFFFSEDATNQNDAGASCRSLGGTLYEPRSESEFNEVISRVDNGGDQDREYWLGLQRDTPEEKFNYISDGTENTLNVDRMQGRSQGQALRYICQGIVPVIPGNRMFSNPNLSPACGSILSGESGEIRSPNYPKSYDDNEDCSWTISVDPGKRIVLRFEDFQLENGYDYLYVYNGDTATDEAKIAGLTGSQIPDPIVSSGNQMLFRFASDFSVTERGFKATYLARLESEVTTPETKPLEPMCKPMTLTSSSGDIQSPNYPQEYENNANCIWTIIVDPDMVVQLSFEYFQLEHSYDWLRIYDSDEINDNALIKLVTGDQAPVQVVSTGNKMTLQFTSDESVTAGGFSVHFDARLEAEITTTAPPPLPSGKDYPPVKDDPSSKVSDCEPITLTGNSGHLESLNYPENYDNNANCIWTILVESGNRIVLDFDNFSLEHGYDYLTVYDDDNMNDNTLLASLTGDLIPGTVVSTGNRMLLHFTSDGTENYRGFSANYVSRLESEPITIQRPRCNDEQKFLCSDSTHGTVCIESSFVCDGYQNCHDGSDEDETLCSTWHCPDPMFQCSTHESGRLCVRQEDLCNGHDDCHDGSDEFYEGCGEIQCQNHGPMEPFRCTTRETGRWCVSPKDLCDGSSDCDDGSDESDSTCEFAQCQSYGPPGFEPFRCTTRETGRWCVSPKDMCDGHEDCDDGSDELTQNCADNCSEFVCENRVSGQVCIPLVFQCDGYNDCDDGYDESVAVCGTEEK